MQIKDVTLDKRQLVRMTQEFIFVHQEGIL